MATVTHPARPESPLYLFHKDYLYLCKVLQTQSATNMQGETKYYCQRQPKWAL